jgi:hypothetical protein
MIPELTLTGSPLERGRTHGEGAHDLIAAAIDRWFEHLSESTEPGPFITRLVGDTGFLDAAERHAPELVDEVRGIAEGAGQPFETMFAWQMIDECWWYLDELLGNLVPAEHCSALAINHDCRGIVAQTQDLDDHFDGAQVMLRHVDLDGLEILSPSLAGLLALNAVNSAGLAVCITTLSPLPHSTDGLSSGFVVPLLTRCRSVDEALELLGRLPIASGNTYTLGTRVRSVVVEASADAVVIDQDGERAIHTNHPFTQVPAWQYDRIPNSEARFAQLAATVQPDSSLDDLVAMYSTGAICRSRGAGNNHISVGTMLFELGDEQVCHYAPGPLDEDSLATYRMQGDADD